MAHASLPPWSPPDGAVVLRTARLTGELTAELGVQPPADPATPSGDVWASALVLGSQVVGHVRVGPVDRSTHAADATVGIDADHRRRGLAAEVGRALVTTALTAQADGGLGLRRLRATAPRSDVAAVKLAGSLRLRREVRARQDVWTPDVGLDDRLGWGVLADEWDLDAGAMRTAPPRAEVGVGPHPEPWPDDDRLDPALLRHGDRRNVADRYRWWTVDAIAADLRARSRPLHVAIENLHHDLNIGTIVRTANAFGVRSVRIVGRRQWNRRGAMVTDRYLDVAHHPDVGSLAAWADAEGLPLIGVDITPGSLSLHDAPLPPACVLLFGQEGPGLTPAALAAAVQVRHIPQVGSTRSVNAGVAAGIAMAEWARQHPPTG